MRTVAARSGQLQRIYFYHFVYSRKFLTTTALQILSLNSHKLNGKNNKKKSKLIYHPQLTKKRTQQILGTKMFVRKKKKKC